jgi:hypothetical protein
MTTVAQPTRHFFSFRFGKIIGFRDGVYEFSCIQVFVPQQGRSLLRKRARCDARSTAS